MKIYNKKGFGCGCFFALLAFLNLGLDIARHTVDAKGLLLCAALLFFSAEAIRRSVSRNLTREDRLEERDERNRLIEARSQSMAFRVTQGLSFALMLLLLIVAKVRGAEELIAVAVGLAFAFGISLFAELFCYLYYESKN